MPVTRLEGVEYSYPETVGAALRGVDLELAPGLSVVAGPSGGGKSTLLRVLNGLVPQFHGGVLRGRATVLGLDAGSTPAATLARRVGFVFQDPELQAVYGGVEREVAFALENTGVAPARMPDLVERALEAAGAAHLLGRRLATLSGGERQRVALAAALALEPDLVVLDEPTSQLDAAGVALVTEACLRLALSGRSVVVAEHRLEALLPAAAEVILVEAGAVAGRGGAAELAAGLPSPPAVVELGLGLGWEPLPLDVGAARALAPPLPPPRQQRTRFSEAAWELRGVTAGPGAAAVLDGIDLAGGRGEVVALMGPNGGGKTTLVRVIAGLLAPASGSTWRSPGRTAYLPQNPSALLHRPTLRAEVELTLGRAGESLEAALPLLERLGLAGLAERYPRDLSSGQRERAALAAVLAGSPSLVLLDEPTRGMDAAARKALLGLVGELAAAGCAVVVATHDSDLAAAAADRVVLVEGGRAVDLGHPARALSGSGPLSTQIGRLYPGGPVTVAGVLARLNSP